MRMLNNSLWLPRTIAVVAVIGLLAFPPLATPSAAGEPQAADVGESIAALVEADWIDRDRRFVASGGPAVDPAAVAAGKINLY
ncbi:MAG: hypothetical protein HQ582_00945, partial [Planctomycetes bacterium]|nr:hypothetical protein [Planctomycetota bacterium]